MDSAGQLRRDGLLGESIHLAGQRMRAAAEAAGEPEPEPEPEAEVEEGSARAAEVAGLATGIREMVPTPTTHAPARTAAAPRRSCPAVDHLAARLLQMKPVVEECDLRVHSVLKSQHDLSTQIEHLACELDRFMGACGEQREALALDPYVEKLDGCKARLANVNTTLNAVEQRMQRMQRHVGVDR